MDKLSNKNGNRVDSILIDAKAQPSEVPKVGIKKESSDFACLKNTLNENQLDSESKGLFKQASMHDFDKYYKIYSNKKILGKGSFAKVILGKNWSTGEKVAIKVFDKTSLSE